MVDVQAGDGYCESPRRVAPAAPDGGPLRIRERPPAGRSRFTRSLIVVGLSVLVLLVFGQVRDHAFLDLDDGEYVYENLHVRAGLTASGIIWAITTTHAANWHPLTWLSHMTDVSLFGLDAGWHHWTSVLIHAANTLALFVVLTAMTEAPWRSACVAALFAVHPLHVESVAWIAERKDVLSTFFWLLTMGLYARYARRPSGWRYLGVAGSFALGLMAKPMLVTLPVVLLLLDYWPLGRRAPGRGERLSRLALEKAPLFALSALSSAVTYLAQAGKGATASLDTFSLADRVSNALVSYVVYLVKTVWPRSLTAFYPHPASLSERTPGWQVALAVATLAILTALALRVRVSRPYLMIGWLWFLGTLVPVIGLVQVGSQAMADRYTYVPLIGIFLAVTWGVSDFAPAGRYRRVLLLALALSSVTALAAVARIQVGTWRDAPTLYTHALAVTERNWLALNNLGNYHLSRGAPRTALPLFAEALRIKPDYDDAWYNLGVCHQRLQDYPRAIAAYREALRLDPSNADGWVNLGLAHQTLGQPAEAIASYQSALRLRPSDAVALGNLALAHALRGDGEQALEAYQRLRRVDPATAVAVARRLGLAR